MQDLYHQPYQSKASVFGAISGFSVYRLGPCKGSLNPKPQALSPTPCLVLLTLLIPSRVRLQAQLRLAQGSEFRVCGLGFGFRVWGLGFTVSGLGFGAWGLLWSSAQALVSCGKVVSSASYDHDELRKPVYRGPFFAPRPLLDLSFFGGNGALARQSDSGY